MIKLKSKRLEIVPEVWRYVPDKGTCHTRPPALSTWQCREFCALLHNFPSDCDGLKTGNIKCCDFIPNVASDYHIKGNISFPSKILQADAGQASSTAAEMFKTTMTTVLGANENQTFSAHFNGTQLLFQVTFKDSANSHLVQSSVEHLEKYPQKFIKSVLVRLSLANKDVIQDDCSHITDPCECAFKDSCAWANGSCSPAPPGPTCQYTEVNGVFNGGWERSGLRSFDEAKKLCTPSSKCNGISCTGNKCAMMKSATVHPASNATHGLLVEIYHSISGSYVSSLTENSKYTSDKPDEALIIRPSGDFDWSSNRGWMGARFTGTFRAKATGRHYFWVTADDMAELWLNDTLVASAKGVSKEGVLSQKGNQHVVDLVESEDVQFKLLYKGWGGPNYVQIWMANGGLDSYRFRVTSKYHNRTCQWRAISQRQVRAQCTGDAKQKRSVDGRAKNGLCRLLTDTPGLLRGIKVMDLETTTIVATLMVSPTSGATPLTQENAGNFAVHLRVSIWLARWLPPPPQLPRLLRAGVRRKLCNSCIHPSVCCAIGRGAAAQQPLTQRSVQSST